MTNQDIAIEINKSGVTVGGHSLPGVTRWSARHDYGRGLFEVQLTLCASSFKSDLGQGDNGMITVFTPKPQLTQHCGPAAAPAQPATKPGPIGIRRVTRHPDGSETWQDFAAPPAAEPAGGQS